MVTVSIIVYHITPIIIIESVDSICRNSTDMHIMINQLIT